MRVWLWVFVYNWIIGGDLIMTKIYSFIWNNHNGYKRIEAKTERQAIKVFKMVTGFKRLPYRCQVIDITRLIGINI